MLRLWLVGWSSGKATRLLAQGSSQEDLLLVAESVDLDKNAVLAITHDNIDQDTVVAPDDPCGWLWSRNGWD